MKETEENWSLVIGPKRSLWSLDLAELWQYRDLLQMFVRRDVVTVYKQTVLGPIWFFVQPIMTMLVYVVIFGNIAGLPTDDIPQPLFYLSGIIIWNYFSDCFMQTSDTFSLNQDMFGKVYFPRLIMPLSKVVAGLIKFAIQFVLFLVVYAYFFIKGVDLAPNAALALVPVYILLMGALGLGFGLIFTSLTTKYRDLKFLVQFGVQLLMYASPIIYPMSMIDQPLLKKAIYYNPLAQVIEGFKYAFLGRGELTWAGFAYAAIFALVVLFLGVFIFNKTERSFMDTV
ncbi:ABC-type polysaccharide/polyol phosphate export system, permease component [Saprospira grandis DSM 2844]|uniref:Transport permease protein n=1 Tax=Saprospira grandis DSM 2844 TaxID=694433 RepID=J1I7X2_9BACT|nr:ABC transporter permease [Saprospira grandis]EJF54920.1 ABC-type polysaccharide/polyol phosphate export system, permease component [Saprospira grandis DSM 2844]